MKSIAVTYKLFNCLNYFSLDKKSTLVFLCFWKIFSIIVMKNKRKNEDDRAKRYKLGTSTIDISIISCTLNLHSKETPLSSLIYWKYDFSITNCTFTPISSRYPTPYFCLHARQFATDSQFLANASGTFLLNKLL